MPAIGRHLLIAFRAIYVAALSQWPQLEQLPPEQEPQLSDPPEQP